MTKNIEIWVEWNTVTITQSNSNGIIIGININNNLSNTNTDFGSSLWINLNCKVIHIPHNIKTESNNKTTKKFHNEYSNSGIADNHIDTEDITIVSQIEPIVL